MSDNDARPAQEGIDDRGSQDYFKGFDGDDFAIDSTPDDTEVPDFPFDQPRSIRLKNGTLHNFSIPTLAQERRKQQLQKTVIITSPAVLNGQNPRSIKTDYSKAQIAHYQDVIETISGYAFDEGDDPSIQLDAKKVIREEPHRINPDKTIPIYLSSLIPASNQIAAISRMYGGKIEVVKPEVKDGHKEVIILNSRRRIKVRQELGIEQNEDGSFSAPDFRIEYLFAEPGSAHLSKWETQCFTGFTVNNPKGGSKEERTFNVDACVRLFDDLIESITGATIGGMPCDAKNSEHLAAIPDSIKVTIISFVMNDATTNSGN